MGKYVIINNELIEAKKVNISILSKANFFDFAVYDSMKVVQGKTFFPKFHVERLIESAKIIGLNHQFKKGDILKSIDLLVKENKLDNSMIRLILIVASDKKEEPMFCIFDVGLSFYDKKDYKKGVKAITFKGERVFPQAKVKCLTLNFVALREAQKRGAKDALLINHNGQILEGTRSNFFAVKNGIVYTAPLTQVLQGITRKILVDIVRANDIPLVEEAIYYSKIKEYDEIFFTSTSMNVMPISMIDDYEVTGGVGSVTKLLMQKFKEYYDREVLNK